MNFLTTSSFHQRPHWSQIPKVFKSCFSFRRYVIRSFCQAFEGETLWQLSRLSGHQLWNLHPVSGYAEKRRTGTAQTSMRVSRVFSCTKVALAFLLSVKGSTVSLKTCKKVVPCRTCTNCTKPDCKMCKLCLDKKKYGGADVWKQGCM